MTTTEIVKGRWYPQAAPALEGETDEQYTNRLIGASGPERRPYDHGRNRQCSIGYHNECSDRQNYGAINKAEGCGCPCHEERFFAPERVAEWNASVEPGTLVSFVEGVEGEPPVTTVGMARVERGWPVVELETFEHPVKLSWLVKP